MCSLIGGFTDPIADDVEFLIILVFTEGSCVYNSNRMNSISLFLRKFESTAQFVNGRYEVALPWKDDFAKERLMNNESIARKKVELTHS